MTKNLVQVSAGRYLFTTLKAFFSLTKRLSVSGLYKIPTNEMFTHDLQVDKDKNERRNLKKEH